MNIRIAPILLIVAIASVILLNYSNAPRSDASAPEAGLSIRLGPPSESVRSIDVPAEIVRSKDCNAFYKFRDEQVPLPFRATVFCPWSSKTGTGKFEIGGMRLNIPRDYLWLQADMPDGAVESGDNSPALYLRAVFPGLKPADQSSPEGPRHIFFDIQPLPRTHFTDRKLGWAFAEYLRAASTSCKGTFDDRRYGCDLNPIHLGRIGWLELDYYKPGPAQEPGLNNAKYKTDLFISGLPDDPSLWIVCEDSVATQCRSAFPHRDRLLITYRFNRFHILEEQHHTALRRDLIALIDSFTE